MRCHRGDEVRELLESAFGSNYLAGGVNKKLGTGWDWPPYSPDLTPLDFSIWTFLKKLILQNKVPNNLMELERLAREAWDNMDPGYIAKSSVQGVENRVRKMVAAGGGRFNG